MAHVRAWGKVESIMHSRSSAALGLGGRSALLQPRRPLLRVLRSHAGRRRCPPAVHPCPTLLPQPHHRSWSRLRASQTDQSVEFVSDAEKFIQSVATADEDLAVLHSVELEGQLRELRDQVRCRLAVVRGRTCGGSGSHWAAWGERSHLRREQLLQQQWQALPSKHCARDIDCPLHHRLRTSSSRWTPSTAPPLRASGGLQWRRARRRPGGRGPRPTCRTWMKPSLQSWAAARPRCVAVLLCSWAGLRLLGGAAAVVAPRRWSLLHSIKG